MEQTERLKRYREVLSQFGSKTLPFKEFAWNVETVSRAEIQEDLSGLGIELADQLEVSSVQEAVERKLAEDLPKVPQFSRFEHLSTYFPDKVKSQPIAAAALEELHSGLCSPTEQWASTELAVRLNLVDSSARLLCLSAMKEGQRPYPHQIQTVRRFLHDLGGSGIVADEVGLGKTVEAGMIIQEYILRGLVRSWLLLVPASLVEHWKEELEKFFPLTFKEPKNRDEALSEPGILLSIDRAKGKMRQTLLARKW